MRLEQFGRGDATAEQRERADEARGEIHSSTCSSKLSNQDSESDLHLTNVTPVPLLLCTDT